MAVRVFWVTTSMPHPSGPGAAALEFEVIAALAQRHEIHVLTTRQDDPLGDGALRDAGAAVVTVPATTLPHPTTKAGVARMLLRADPNLIVWLGRDRIRALREAVLDASARVGQPDVVQITDGDLAPIVEGLPHATGLLLFDCLTHALHTRRAIEPLPRRRLQLRLESFRTARYERRWYRQATGLLCVSPVDADWVARLTGRSATVVEIAVGARFFEPPAVPRSRDVVAFVGSLTHRPNADAIEWLAREVWPHVVSARPGARLVVTGRSDVAGAAAVRLRPIVEGAGGELRVDVDDIRPTYWEAAVVVAPIREGSGMRIKVSHALACGAPLVATARALEGVPALVARHVRVAPGDDAVAFARAIVATLDDPPANDPRADLAPLATAEVAHRYERWWQELAWLGSGRSAAEL